MHSEYCGDLPVLMTEYTNQRIEDYILKFDQKYKPSAFGNIML